MSSDILRAHARYVATLTSRNKNVNVNGRESKMVFKQMHCARFARDMSRLSRVATIWALVLMLGAITVSAMTITPPSGTLGNAPYSTDIAFTSIGWVSASQPLHFQDCTYIIDGVTTVDTVLPSCWGLDDDCKWTKTVPVTFIQGEHIINASCTTWLFSGFPPTQTYFYDIGDGNIYHVDAQVKSSAVLGLGRCSNTSLINMAEQLALFLIIIITTVGIAAGIAPKHTIQSKLFVAMGVIVGLALLGFAMTILVGC